MSLAKSADEGHFAAVREHFDQTPPGQVEMDLALARACCNGRLEIAGFLIDQGADPNGQYRTPEGNFDYGPIILASCEFLNVEGIRFLVDRGANPAGNLPDSKFQQVCTPLEMVEKSYQEDEAARRDCMELLTTAMGKSAMS